MSTREEREGDDSYEATNDEAPIPSSPVDDSYTTGAGEPMPVQKDGTEYEDPMQPPESNSDEQLGELLNLQKKVTCKLSRL